MKYRKKPVVIEAVQVPPEGESFSDEEQDWLFQSDRDFDNGGDGSLYIHTLEGTMTAEPGDWVIKGVKGELYPCKPDIFEATYEPVDG